MDESILLLMVFSLFLGCGCWLIFLWAVQKGEFSDIERPKHRMLEDENLEAFNRDGQDVQDRSEKHVQTR